MAESSQNTSADATTQFVLQQLVGELIVEKRRSRRWGIFFRLFWIGLLLLTLGFFMLGPWLAAHYGDVGGGSHTALVELDGEIADDTPANADNIKASLQDAFDDAGTRGVVLRIDSPGGSPVQASQIYSEVRRLRALHPDIPVYAVCDDVCASAAYFVAAATDRIYVNPASLVGSIGVLMDGFDFTGLMGKLGVSRRLLTAGDNKGFLDPYSPMPPQQKAYALAMLEQIHQQFIAAVEQGRGKRLKIDDQTFSGLPWTGEQALKQGLVDGYGDLDSVARDVVKAPDVIDFTQRENVVDRLARRFGAELARGAARAALPSGLVLR